MIRRYEALRLAALGTAVDEIVAESYRTAENGDHEPLDVLDFLADMAQRLQFIVDNGEASQS